MNATGMSNPRGIGHPATCGGLTAECRHCFAACDPKLHPPAKGEHFVVQIITIRAFRRPSNPKRCNVHLYHVWRSNFWPMPAKQRCQCTLLEWRERT